MRFALGLAAAFALLLTCPNVEAAKRFTIVHSGNGYYLLKEKARGRVFRRMNRAAREGHGLPVQPPNTDDDGKVPVPPNPFSE